MLMGIGSLATIGVAAPPNLAICVIDNQRYGETGMQETHTGYGGDLAAMAAGAGFAHTETVWTKKMWSRRSRISTRQRVRSLWNIKVNTDYVPMVLLMRDGTAIPSRFREAVLGDRAFD